MNEQTKTHIENLREIQRLQRSIDKLNRSLEISNAINEAYEKMTKNLLDKIKELKSQIDAI